MFRLPFHYSYQWGKQQVRRSFFTGSPLQRWWNEYQVTAHAYSYAPPCYYYWPRRTDIPYILLNSDLGETAEAHAHSPEISKLHINERTITEAWKCHFSSRSKTKITDAVVDQTLQDELIRNVHSSHNNEDHVFDIDLEFEEVDKAVVHLSNGKAAGPDGMTGEHLKYGGSLLRTWITQIFNAILLLKCVPSSFKIANITPVYKRKGKDPLDPNSYRGIGVSNILSKLFESLILSRMLPELRCRGFPLIQQTAYQSGISCVDATFAAYETLSYLTRNGNTVLQTFYDLEKAFDSVEYCILLKHLFSRGIHGKCWRINPLPVLR